MKPRAVAAVIAAAAAILVLGWAVTVHHLGAPRLPIHCVPPDHPVLAWYPDGSAPSTSTAVHWFGSTEIGGCGESLAIGLRTMPRTPAALAVWVWDQSDGKYVYLGLAVLLVMGVARSRWLRRILARRVRSHRRRRLT